MPHVLTAFAAADDHFATIEVDILTRSVRHSRTRSPLPYMSSTASRGILRVVEDSADLTFREHDPYASRDAGWRHAVKAMEGRMQHADSPTNPHRSVADESPLIPAPLAGDLPRA
jgi:hypothetical protein